MKKISRILLSFLNKLFLLPYYSRTRLFRNRFFLVTFAIRKGNTINTEQCEFVKTSVTINGSNNTIQSFKSTIVRSKILIEGSNNQLVMGSNVNLRNTYVIIRGDNCSVTIGNNTKFNGGRIVNGGKDNAIQIGDNCLVSDQVEIWASDTHKILDSENNILNNAKPIVIGDNVWVGCRVTILKGTTISNGSIIGMGTVVTKDVGEREISIGIPNRILKSGVFWKE